MFSSCKRELFFIFRIKWHQFWSLLIQTVNWVVYVIVEHIQKSNNVTVLDICRGNSYFS